ncbi:MbcA/ParS/Xre antitoxin family protein [Castellaniella ginsengisoli]|uniref:MbcA/ParS/Xre antitoxin family protein n=1 Tax=Castellaniella ginsengisoli TaxID=546114 RepID=A0AB39CJ44_9BURK
MLNSRDPKKEQLAALRAEVVRMVAESGNPEGFDPDSWLQQWLSSPNPALGNRQPDSLLDSPDGFQDVLDVLRSMQSGAYR